MPDAVNTFIASNNIDEVRGVQRDLHALYRSDITKYAPASLRLIIRDIYDLIPNEATSRSRRFKLSDIRDVKRFDQVESHFLWLTQAGVALPVFNIAAPVSPLLVAEQRNKFKLFYHDVGMLASTLPKQAFDGLLDGRPTANAGSLYEAFVAQELVTGGFKPRYFTSKRVGELDFVVEHLDGRIGAIEVKSGKKYLTHAAIDNALAVDNYTIDEAFVFAETNICRRDHLLYAPVFLTGALQFE